MGDPVLISNELRESLGRFIRSRGAKAAAVALEVSVPTLARAAAGMPVQRTTATHLDVKLKSAKDAGPGVAKSPSAA